jgi:hypothetical protein
MSRKLFAFLLSELKTIRVVCQTCQAATELLVEQAGARNYYTCPGCHTQMNGAGTLRELAKCIELLQRADKNDPGRKFDVEFVLPDESEAK